MRPVQMGLLRAAALLAGLLASGAAQAQCAAPVPGGCFAPCVVGVSSTQCLSAITAGQNRIHVQLQNVTQAGTPIACRWGGTPALYGASSFLLAGTGAAANWGGATGWVGTAALNCIAASAGGQLYIEVQ